MNTELIPCLEGLGEILSEQITAHKELAGYALNLREALVACNHEAIERISRENERAAAKVKRLENKRMSFMREAGFPDVQLPLSRVIEHAMADRQLTEDEFDALDKLSIIRAKLAEVINEVDHHNQLNMTLLGQALEFQEFSLQLLINATAGETTGYTPDGPSRPNDGAGLFEGHA